MKFGVITFPGSNCNMDMVHALGHDLNFDVVQLWHKDHDLQGADIVVLPGGFSYGDYLRSGAIARFSPIMESVVEHAKKGGKVFGVCNGFQILCEAGLLPGALLHNESRQFICRNVTLKPVSRTASISRELEGKKPLTIPIAHGEGNYHIGQDGLKMLEDNDQILFQYVDAEGDLTDHANPNGSRANIAGICNEKRNVGGMMPHPERAVESILGSDDGIDIFKSMIGIA